MKKALCLGLALGFGLALVTMVPEARAGEVRKGTIYTYDAGYSSNAITGYGFAGCAAGSSCNQAFSLSSLNFITIQCDQACHVSTDVAHCDAGTCAVKLAADEKFYTRINGPITVTLPDAGSYTGGVVAVHPVAGATTCLCKVSQRWGNE